MIYWILFLFVEYFLLYAFSIRKNQRERGVLLFFIILSIVYFSGFRDCLGMDYEGYRILCERERTVDELSWLLNEPLYEYVRNFCATTKYSAVIFFLVSAILTSVPALIIYSKYENFFLSGFVYLTYTGLFLFSFNVVRQFAAAGILLIAALFLLKNRYKDKILFTVFVLIAALYHKSSLFFIVALFMGKKNYNVGGIVLLLLISIFVPISQIKGVSFIADIVNAMDYSSYFNYDNISVGKFSLSNIYMHLMLIPFLVNKRVVLAQKDSEMYVISLKMFVIFLMCNNLSSNGIPIAYRIGIFFSMYIPILFAKFPVILGNKILGYSLIVFPLLILFFLIGLSSNIVIPDRMLPLNSIFDSVYSNFH